MARSPQRQKKPDMTAIYAFMGIAIAAILTAAYVAKKQNEAKANQKQAAPAPQVEDNPFADLEAKPPKLPSRSTSKRKEYTDLAPPSTISDPIWVEAKAQASIALKLIDEAEVAKSKKNFVLYEQKAVAGREILDEQLVNTADWEAELFDKYGSNDRVIDKIAAQRSRWFKKVNKYRKVKTGGSGG